MDAYTLGNMIKEARKRKGLKQEDLAREMNVSKTTISKWESGTNSPDVFKLQRLARILDIPPNIFTDENYYPDFSQTTVSTSPIANDTEPDISSTSFPTPQKKNLHLPVFILLGIMVCLLLGIIIYHLRPYRIIDSYYISDYEDYDQVFCLDIISNVNLTFETTMDYGETLENRYYDRYNSADAIIIRFFPSWKSYKRGDYDYLLTLLPIEDLPTD